jgi:hypothetical protein
MMKRRFVRLPLSLVLAGSVALACAQIAGIEDRELADETDQAKVALCTEYCNTVAEACPHPRLSSQHSINYTTKDTCIGTCMLLPEGDENELASTPNSIRCRLNAAIQARNESVSERDDFCQAAGPGGNGQCGENCESYCMLVEQACEGFNATIPDCTEKCAAFGSSGRHDVGGGGEEADHSGDTVQCRLVHVSSATIDPEGHCNHADFHASAWCELEEPSCEHYCRVASVACTDDNAIYENDDQCMATCQALELGDDVRDDTADDIACRTWHGVSALADPGKHCPHAGPTGDGHCGLDDPEEGTFAACRPYCRLLEAACGDMFAAAWEDQDECIEECDDSEPAFGVKENQNYTVKKSEASGDTLGCRTLHAVRAFEDNANCDAAFGAGPCD